MPSTQAQKDAVLNVRRGTTFTSYTAFMGLLTSKPDFAASTATEIAYTGYARQSGTFAAPTTPSLLTRRTATSAVITWGTMTAGVGGQCGYVGEFSASSAGTLYHAEPLPDTGSALTITGATNATPIVITTSAAHNLASNMFVRNASVGGNTAANAEFQITVISGTTYSLNGSVGNGAYTSGGTSQRFGFEVVVNSTPSIASGSYTQSVLDA